MDDVDVAGENSPPASTSQPNGHSGITLVLPSLRALKAANAGKKGKGKLAIAEPEQRPKIPRPVKLKPLKEVLTKLITQIKKRDDYAFFIQPVDPTQVPGYADMIKNPMDLGTMSVKVVKGRYRSLEEFTNDFRLVTANAKTFNPPGSIYHSEADRLEAWGLEHIARASAHVIEYETDWNIDIEQDDDGSTSQLPVNVDDEVSTPRDIDGSMAAGSRAPSMTPAPGQVPIHGPGKRGPRGPYKKHAQPALQEGLDAEGRMPGAKDGVGAFPPGSDWAELMIALKIKGKRYKTKKERLRFEREGPPYHADGSLDYSEMEDPFSVLNVLVPEPPSRPQVTPLYPPPSTQPPSQMSQPRTYTPIPIIVPPDRPTPDLSTLSNVPTQPTPITSTFVPSARPPKKRRHWTIIRNVPARSRAKDKEPDTTADDTKTSWKVPRDPGPADYGTFAMFLGALAASAASPTTGTTAGTAEYVYGSEHQLFATIRSTVERHGVKRKREAEADPAQTEEGKESAEAFWTDARAEQAWDYLRDIVYGGVDGYAYVRSLAEFVAPSVYLNDDACKAMAADRDGRAEGAPEGVDVKPTLAPEENHAEAHPLGVPLARYIEDNLVDMVTRGRHGWLRDVLLPAADVNDRGPNGSFRSRMSRLPGAARAVATLTERSEEPLDMAALVREPGELDTEGVLEGGPGEGEIERALLWGVGVIEALCQKAKYEPPSDGDSEAKVEVKEEAVDDARVAEEEEEEEVANAMDVDPDTDPIPSESQLKTEADAENPLVQRLRMNLLALAKRTPMAKIPQLSPQCVPENTA